MTGADYLDRALNIIEQCSLRRAEINWANFRRAALADLKANATVEESYPALVAALKRLADGHSFFATPAQLQWHEQQVQREPGEPTGRILAGPIGYVHVPAFVTTVLDRARRFATQTQDVIRNIASAGLAGWIVDLRENTGGDMWPMIAGLGPILGEGMLGAFVAPDGAQKSWFYRQGSAGCEGGPEPIFPPPSFLPTGPVYCRVDQPFRLAVPDPAVAVLIGPKTASAGEAVALAFRGRPRSRSFGASTCGLTTANSVFELSDGGLLFLTTMVEADRTGRQFSSSIEPDESVTDADGSSDPALAAASAWLLRTR